METKLVHVSHVSGDLYVLRPFHATDPGYGQGGGGHPDHSLPGGGGHPSHGLPGNPNFPSNSLPSGPPPHIPLGATLVLVRSGTTGVWHYAAIAPGQPVPPLLPDQSLPGVPPPMPGYELPPTEATPKGP